MTADSTLHGHFHTSMLKSTITNHHFTRTPAYITPTRADSPMLMHHPSTQQLQQRAPFTHTALHIAGSRAAALTAAHPKTHHGPTPTCLISRRSHACLILRSLLHHPHPPPPPTAPSSHSTYTFTWHQSTYPHSYTVHSLTCCLRIEG